MGVKRSPIRYRGPDRRSMPSRRESAGPGRVAREAAWLIVLGALAVVAAKLAERLVPETAPAVSLLLGGLGSGLCFVVASACLVRWRLVGDGVAIRAALGFAVYGTAVAPLVARTADGPVGALVQTCGTVIAVGTLLAAGFGPEIDGGFPAGRAVLALGTGLLAVIGTVAVIPELAPRAAVSRFGPGPALATGTFALVVLAAAALVVTGLRRDRGLLTAAGVALVALAAAPVAMALRAPEISGPLYASALQLIGLLLVMRTVVADARHALDTVARDDLDLRLRWRHAVAQAEEVTRSQHERSHEIRSALLAVEGAGQVLARRLEDLGDRANASLAVAVQREAGRLREISSHTEDQPAGPYDILESLVPLVTAHRATGQRITLDIPAGLRAEGRPHALAEVVSNLLVNCARHAPGASVTITGLPGAGPGRVSLVVADDGPGFPADGLRHAIERGWRGPDPQDPGSGLGLFLASHLMVQEGGGLTLVPLPPGTNGAVVALDLPEPPAAQARDDALDLADAS